MEGAARWRDRAIRLKAAFNERFWLQDRQYFAVGLDGDKRPIDALASNMGHCLWTGIVDEAKAPVVADRLSSPEMFSGWGIRTLASSMKGYNPIGYHTGSVWPHDNAIVASGLMRYGFAEQAHRVIMSLVDASTLQGNRLPELFSGLDRDELPTVVTYPASCMPQAWAAAAPLAFLRTLLRLDPWIPHRRMWIAPALPPEVRSLHVNGIRLAGSRVSVHVEDGEVSLEGLPDDLEWVPTPRRSQAAI